MIGQVGVGIPFFMFLSYWWDGVNFLSAVGLLTCSFTCYLLYREKRIDWLASSVVAILCIVTMAATPVIAYTCTTGLPLHYILTSTGYTLAMLLVWGRWQISLLGYGVWLYFANDLFRTVPWECRFIVRLPISAIIFLFPFGIFLIWISFKGFAKFSKSETEIALRNLMLAEEQSKLNVALENISELNNSAVTKILDVISEVESTSKLSDEGYFKLHQLDSQLRTQIQLDPLGVGTLTNLAAKMADAAVASGSWLNVRALYGDSEIFALLKRWRMHLLSLPAKSRQAHQFKFLQVVVKLHCPCEYLTFLWLTLNLSLSIFWRRLIKLSWNSFWKKILMKRKLF